MSCSHWFCYYCCCCCCCRSCSTKQSSTKVAQVEPEDQRTSVAATSHHRHSVSPSARIKQQQQQLSNPSLNPRQKEIGKQHPNQKLAHSSRPQSSAAAATALSPPSLVPLERLSRSASTPIRKYRLHKPNKGGKSPKSTLSSASNATAISAINSASSTTAVPGGRTPVSSSPIAITSGAVHTGSPTTVATTELLSSSASGASKGTEAKSEFTISQMESPPDWPPTEPPPVQVGNVTAWSTDFDVLLADPLGVRAFEDFLSREFSVENLSFFLACRRLYGQSGSTLSTSIEHIYKTYLSTEATEAVNIDSSAIKQIEAALVGEHRNHTLFAPAEKQIYNLMKFDCYPRFLRSHVYTECLSAEQSGRPLPYEEQGGVGGFKKFTSATSRQSATTAATPVDSASADHSPGQSSEEPGKGQSGNFGKSKRRSFLPWARIKNSLVNAKAASLSSMPASKESTGGSTSSSAAAAFRRPMAVRKFASSITYKLRSRSLDEHIHANTSARPSASPNSSTEKSPAGLAGHSSSVEQTVSRGDGGQEESLDLDSAAPVFSPSPDECISGGVSRVASLSSCSTSAEGSPVSATPPHPSLLRVTFPDGSTTVVACSKSAESLGDLIHRLLLKRGFDWLKEFEVYKTSADNAPLNLTAPVSSLGCSEVRIHARNLSAKAKPRLNAFSLLHPTAHSSGSASLDHSPTGAKPQPQRVQRSLEEGPVTNPSAPMRRFNSVNIEAVQGSVTSGLAKPNYTQTNHPKKASPPNIPQTIPRPKASHLRDLQNHRHFKSQSEGPEVSPKASKPIEMAFSQSEQHSSSTVSQTPDSPKPSLRRFTSDPPLPELSQSSSASSKEGNIHSNAPSTISPKSLPSLFHVHLDHGHHHHHHHHHPHHPIIYHTQFQHHEHSHVHLIPQRRSSGNSTASVGAATSAATPMTGKMAKNSSLS